MSNLNANTPQLKVLKNFIDAYLSLDINKAHQFASKHYTHQTFPEIAGVPKEGREAHVRRFGGILASLTKLEATFHEVIEAPGKVVLHANAVYSTKSGTTGDYDTVVIFTLVEEDGELKVQGSKDFADPEKRNTFFAVTAPAS